MKDTFFTSKIVQWYHSNKRDLPWRKTQDPYKIWLSEILLQQTQVAQGLPYYEAFVREYPTIDKLAGVAESEVLRLWQGLGYYSRARNLHFTAKYIVNELNSEFPDNHKEIQKLKGIGPYTAAAIASFAFGEKTAVVDGNVIRVLCRYFGIESDASSPSTLKELRTLANELLPETDSSDYNQGIMEFGAIQCKPKNPKCSQCPMMDKCFAFNHQVVDTLPFKKKKVKQRDRYFHYLVVKGAEDKILMKQRSENDIWANMYDFPLIENNKQLKTDQVLSSNEFKALNLQNYTLKASDSIKHVLSHQIIHAQFYSFEDAGLLAKKSSDFKLLTKREVDEKPKPILIHNYLKKHYF